MFNDYIQKIIENLDISAIIGEYVNIIKKGKNYSALCPFHDDNNPSLSISNEKNIFKCFVCGEGGNVIHFVSKYEKISFNSAIKKLAEKAGIKIDESLIDKPIYNETDKQIIDSLNEAKMFFQYNLSTKEGNKAKKYLHSRNILNSSIEKYSIGYAPDEGLIKFLISKGHDESTLINASLINQYGNSFFKNRIMFPIQNKYGDVIGFSGRSFKNDAYKYINSSESRIFKKSSTFYNMNHAMDYIQKAKEVFINEGFMDIIALDKIEIKNCLAIMGTSLTIQHLPFLKGKKVNLMFDFDNPGIDATIKSISFLLKNNIKVKIIYDTIGKDADEILNKYGKEKLKQIVNNKKNAFEFIYILFKKEIDLNDPDSIKKFLIKFGDYLKFGDSLERNFYINKMSKELHISDKSIKSFIPSHQKPIYISKEKNKQKLKEKNYLNILFKSLYKNKNLLKYYKFEDIYFFDSISSKIGWYFALFKKNNFEKQSKKNDFKTILSKIDKEVDDNDIIKSKQELDDLVEQINLINETKEKEKLKKKIKIAKTDKEKESYLKSIQELQRKKSR